MIFIYTEDEPGRRLVSAAGTPKDRAAVFATEMQRLGFHKVAWLEGPFGLTQVFAVAVTAPDATQRQQMPAEVCGFKLREAGFDPGALPHPLVQATDHLDEP